MLTDLEIVNNALGRLGVERVASLSDSNKRAKLANDYLQSSRLATLEMSNWAFACRREKLTSDGTPAFEYSHSFSKPSDLIKIVEEFNGESYFEEGDSILADTDTLLIKFVYEIDENVKRSPNFDKAWYIVLASEMAYSLTQNAALSASLMAEADAIASKAASLSSASSTPKDYQFDTFLDARR